MSYSLAIPGVPETRLLELGVAVDRTAGVFRDAETGEPFDHRGSVLKLLKAAERNTNGDNNNTNGALGKTSPAIQLDLVDVYEDKRLALNSLVNFFQLNLISPGQESDNLQPTAEFINRSSLKEALETWAPHIQSLLWLQQDQYIKQDQITRVENIEARIRSLASTIRCDDDQFSGLESLEFRVQALLDPKAPPPSYVNERRRIQETLRQLKVDANNPPARYLNFVLGTLIAKAEPGLQEPYAHDFIRGMRNFYTRDWAKNQQAVFRRWKQPVLRLAPPVPEKVRKSLRTYFNINWPGFIDQLQSIIAEEAKLKKLDLDFEIEHALKSVEDTHSLLLMNSRKAADPTSTQNNTVNTVKSDFQRCNNPQVLWASCVKHLILLLEERGLTISREFLNAATKYLFKKAKPR